VLVYLQRSLLERGPEVRFHFGLLGRCTAVLADDSPPAVVVFACVHNAGRSQMAAALFNQLADPTKARARSAGTRPGTAVHPEVVETMREAGVDLSEVRPQLLTRALAADATLLVTMGCGEECPVVPGVQRDDWPLPDPKGRPIEEVRAIRDDIRARVAALVDSRGWAR
jgi:arsenate reductase